MSTRLVLLSLALCSGAEAQSWPGERARLELRIESDGGWPRETAVKVSFDHAAEVDAGTSRADGLDVVLLERVSDGGLEPRHRVLDPGSAWNRPDTELWFKLDEPLDAGMRSLSLGGLPAGLEDARQVFLFADDFEDGDIDDWTTLRNSAGTPLQLADAGAHRGAYAMMNAPNGSGAFQALAPRQRPLPLDVVLDAWVFMDDPPAAQWAWFLRFDAMRDDSYNFGPDAAAGNWRAGQRLAGAYTRYPGAVPFSASPARQWLRVVFSVQGQALGGCVASTCIDGGVAAPTLFLDAGLGFGRVLTSADVDGGRRLLIDDVTIRPYVVPDARAELGARLLGEDEPCAMDLQCVSGRCVGTCRPASFDAGTSDAGVPDAGAPDAGTSDAGTSDAGAPDSGVDTLAEPMPQPGDYLVGCGCAKAPGAVAWIAMLALARRRRELRQ